MNNKFHLIISFIVLLSCFSNNSYSGNYEEVKPKIQQLFQDAQGREYQFRLTYEIKNGLAKYIYDFGRSGKFKKIYQGQSFGDGETCPEDKRVLLSIATIKRDYIVKDINKDGIKDIILSVIEQNCETSALSFKEAIIFSTTTAFKVKTIQHVE